MGKTLNEKRSIRAFRDSVMQEEEEYLVECREVFDTFGTDDQWSIEQMVFHSHIHLDAHDDLYYVDHGYGLWPYIVRCEHSCGVKLHLVANSLEDAVKKYHEWVETGYSQYARSR